MGLGGRSSHEPPLSRPSATLSPPCGERAGRGVPIWFMVPLPAKQRKEASHDPSRGRVADPRSGPRLCEAQRFMVPMRAQKRVEALHEPPPHPIPLPLGGGEGARRAGEGVVHGPNACEKRKGAFHEPGGASVLASPNFYPLDQGSTESRPTVHGPNSRPPPTHVHFWRSVFSLLVWLSRVGFRRSEP